VSNRRKIDEAQAGVGDPLPQSARMSAASADFMAHWPNAPAHRNPVPAAVVAGWFRDAFKSGPAPDEAAVRSLVCWLNIAGPWDTDDVKRLTIIPPEYKNLSKAIDTIIAVAPALLEYAALRSREIVGDEFRDRMSRKWHDDRARKLGTLVDGARAAAVEFPLISSGGKKKPATWTITAQTAASFIAAAMPRTGHRALNFNGGPALEVLQHAMHHLEGKERPLSQLREAFRRKKN